jgi:uncharacterized protein YndB with AHSA1/START domain
MRFLKWLLGSVLGLVALLAVVGWMLSPRYTVSRSTTINAAPDKAYALVADPRHWKDWTVWNRRDPAMVLSFSGPPSGAGAGWAWKSATEGNGGMVFTAAEPGQRLAYELTMEGFHTSPGELRFAAKGNATEVTWVMNGDMGANPFMRWITLFADRMMGPDFEAGLAGLKALAEKT